MKFNYCEEHKKLQNLVVGDKVIIFYREDCVKCESIVTGVTKTVLKVEDCYLDGEKYQISFNKEDGQEKNKGGKFILVSTPELKEYLEKFDILMDVFNLYRKNISDSFNDRHNWSLEHLEKVVIALKNLDQLLSFKTKSYC